MMKMRLCTDERRLLGFQRTKRETGVGSITPAIDLERGIAARMQESRVGWCEAGPVSMQDCKASHGGGGSWKQEMQPLSMRGCKASHRGG